jgi:hypothetical protein
MTMAGTSVYVPGALTSLRDSFAIYLDEAQSPKAARIHLAALDGLIRHLQEKGMPLGARAVRREHVEGYFGGRRKTAKPATLSFEFRALQQFWKWAPDTGVRVGEFVELHLADVEVRDRLALRHRPPRRQPALRRTSENDELEADDVLAARVDVSEQRT